MANHERFLDRSITRRQLVIGASASLLHLSSPPALALEVPQPPVETFDPFKAKIELTTEMNQRFGIIFPESEISEGRDLPLYANFYRALLVYQSAGITNFSNDHTGDLHFVVNSGGKPLTGNAPPFKSPIGYYWNNDIPQLVFNWPKDNLPTWWQTDRNAPKIGIEAFYNERATIYALHELFHPLQHKTIGPSESYNHSRVILTPAMQDFAQTVGIAVASTNEEIETKPPWELKYEYHGVEPWSEELRRFDWRLGDGTNPNPIVEGSAVSVSQYLWNRTLFKDRFPNHAMWAEREIEGLKVA